jgi:hypothetical protein
MKICQRGTDKGLPEKEISVAAFRRRLKNVCKKLTQKQRKVTVWALLIVFTVLVAVSVTDIFRNGAKLSEPKHISPLKTLENSPIDTISLKTIDNETE